jgi:NitT/TauT family transport system substrate-binding protein
MQRTRGILQSGLARTGVAQSAALLLALSLVAPGGSALAADAGAKKGLVDVNIGGIPGLSQMFYPYLAGKKGFFEKHGIHANMVNIQTGPGLVLALLGGSSDISMAGPQLLWPPLKKGEPIVVVAGAIKLNYLLVTCGDTPVPHAHDPYPKNLQDLKGKSIGAIGLGTQTMNLAESLTRAAGFTPGQEVKLVAVGGPATMVPACKSHKVDFIIAPPPLEELLGTENKDYVVVASATMPSTTGDAYAGLFADTYATTAGYIKDHRAQVSGFCAAMVDARDFATNRANLAEVAKLYAEYTQIPLDKAMDFWPKHQDELLIPVTQAAWKRQAAGVKGELSTFVPEFDAHVDKVCTGILQRAPGAK